MAASALVLSGFSFKTRGVTDEELKMAAALIDDWPNQSEPDERRNSGDQGEECLDGEHCGEDDNEEGSSSECGKKWELLVDKPGFKLWKRPIMPDSYLCEYRVYGTYEDISAAAFFHAQMDLEYRKEWDNLVIALDSVEMEKTSGQEVIRWISYYPYPMYPREYVFARRANVDTTNKLMVLISRSVEHPSIEEEPDKYVRVESYYSRMIIRPHNSDFHTNGFDYVMTYFDDPKAPFPGAAYRWMAAYGVPDYCDKVHTAAKNLPEEKTAGPDSCQPIKGEINGDVEDSCVEFGGFYVSNIRLSQSD